MRRLYNNTGYLMSQILESIRLRLLIVRHGTTLNNAEARYTGQSDVELSPLGEYEAKQLGERLSRDTLDVIVSSDLRRTRATAQAIAQNAPLSVRQAKKSIQAGLQVDLHRGLGIEIEAYNHLVPTEDRREGIRAFLEKRKPVFTGH